MESTTVSEMSEMCELLAELNPADLDFHAARYESAALYQNLIETVQRFGALSADEMTLRVINIAEATSGDGGDYLTIPCLGGQPQEVWQTLCYAFKDVLDWWE